jgi:hypothetical protein
VGGPDSVSAPDLADLRGRALVVHVRDRAAHRRQLSRDARSALLRVDVLVDSSSIPRQKKGR